VSKIQKAQLSNRQYFNCIVQSSENPIRAVCYSPEKRAQIHAIASSKSPVKLRNYKLGDHGNDLVITKHTKIHPLAREDIPFAISEELAASSTGDPIKLCSVHTLAGEQLISVKGQVSSISAVKTVSTHFSANTPKQDIIIRDPTASFKVVLWGDHVDSLTLNQTYLFKNIRVKITKYERYLNTPRSDEFTANEIEPFTDPLVPLEQEVNTTSIITGSIIGVHKTFKTLICQSCQKRSIDVSGNLAVCQACELSQVPASCPVHWLVRLLVKPEDSTKKLRLNLSNEVLKQFFSIRDIPVDLTTISEEDLILSILDTSLEKFKMTYDNLTNELVNINID
jgi:hypothetical protein